MLESAAVSCPSEKARLHLGCGSVTPDEWINVDGSWNARIEKHRMLSRALRRSGLVSERAAHASWSSDILIHDVRKPLPFPSDRFSAVYASHLLEHLYHDEAQRLLADCRRVLHRGGILRVVVPDLRAITQQYFDGIADWETKGLRSEKYPADLMNERMLFRDKNAPGGNVLYKAYSLILDFHSHKWMYDCQSLIGHVQEAGFKNVNERGFLDSDIQQIAEVERPGRVLNGEGICVEGQKL
jgi:predicted SAM-dependent methyltransferase